MQQPTRPDPPEPLIDRRRRVRERISSRRNPLVAACRALARERPPESGRVLLDGVHLVRDAWAAGVRILVAAVSARRLDAGDPELVELADALERAGVRLVAATEDVMEALSPVRSPSPLVAIAEHGPAPLGRLFAPAPALGLVLTDVQDPGNVGAAIRAAEAAGATGVAVVGASADPFGWKALRASMGSTLRLPVARVRESGAVLDAARRAGVRALAAVPRGGRELYEIDLDRPLAIWLGNEGAGLPRELVDQVDDTVVVPMRPPVDSLNVAVTAAVILYEASRQRTRRRAATAPASSEAVAPWTDPEIP